MDPVPVGCAGRGVYSARSWSPRRKHDCLIACQLSCKHWRDRVETGELAAIILELIDDGFNKRPECRGLHAAATSRPPVSGPHDI